MPIQKTTCFLFVIYSCSMHGLTNAHAARSEIIEPLPEQLTYLADVSDDGNCLWTSYESARGALGGRWSSAGTLTTLERLVNPQRTDLWIYGCDGNGQVAVGVSAGRATRWNEFGQPEGIPTPSSSSYSAATGVSADGSIIVGYSEDYGNQSSWVWSAASGAVYLGTPSGTHGVVTNGVAMAVSADGGTMVGYGRYRDRLNNPSAIACLWTATNAGYVLGTLPYGTWSDAYAVNSDGSVVVGAATSGQQTFQFRWKRGLGMESLGGLPDAQHSFTTDVSGNGSVVVGYSDQIATRWTSDDGMQPLSVWLSSNGVDMSGWSHLATTMVNADGTVYAGTGIFNGQSRIFRAVVPTRLVTTVDQGNSVTQTTLGYPLISGTRAMDKVGGGELRLTEANTITGSTTICEGVLVLEHPQALERSRVTVADGGTLQVASTAAAKVPSLMIATGGLVDLQRGELTVVAGVAASDVVGWLRQGYGDGSWNGTTGITSSAATEDLAAFLPRSVGWCANPDGSHTIRYAAPGDITLDGMVDILDVAYFLVSRKFDTGRAAVWRDGDFNYDGVADLIDVAALVSTGLYDVGPYTPTSNTLATVPEPTLWLAALVGAAFGSRWILRPRLQRHRLPSRGYGMESNTPRHPFRGGFFRTGNALFERAA
jgi:autotransporter-associated beta strand protein